MTEPRLIQYLEIILIIIPCRSACTRSLSTWEGFCWSIQMDWKYTIFDWYKVDVGDMWWEKMKVNENHLALATSPVYEIVILDLLQTLFSSTSLLHHALLPCLSLSSNTFPLIFYNTNMLPPLLPLLIVPAHLPPIRGKNSSDLASLSLTQWWPSRHHSTESENCLKIFHRIIKGKHCFNVRPPILP